MLSNCRWPISFDSISKPSANKRESPKRSGISGRSLIKRQNNRVLIKISAEMHLLLLDPCRWCCPPRRTLPYHLDSHTGLEVDSRRHLVRSFFKVVPCEEQYQMLSTNLSKKTHASDFLGNKTQNSSHYTHI